MNGVSKGVIMIWFETKCCKKEGFSGYQPLPHWCEWQRLSLGNLNSLAASLEVQKATKYMLYNTIQYNTIQYNAMQCNTIQYNTIQYNTIQYNTIQYNTIQYNTIQYNTIQYNCLFRAPIAKNKSYSKAQFTSSFQRFAV